jgi:hypothetical protein
MAVGGAIEAMFVQRIAFGCMVGLPSQRQQRSTQSASGTPLISHSNTENGSVFVMSKCKALT